MKDETFKLKVSLAFLDGVQHTVPVAKETAPEEFTEQTTIKLPTSDHNMIIIKTPLGTFGVWNILHPASPVAPGLTPPDVSGMFRIMTIEDREKHLADVAEAIAHFFKYTEIDGFILQEVPKKHSDYFHLLCRELMRHFIDTDSLIKSYAHTYHSEEPKLKHEGFGTALILKKQGHLTLEKSRPDFLSKDQKGMRGCFYDLKSKESGKGLTILNIHGEYESDTTELVEKLIGFAEMENTIVCGDTNIPLTNKAALKRIQETPGVFVEPNTNCEGTPEASRTLDCALSSIPGTKYIFDDSLKNYAKDPSDCTPSSPIPSFFQPAEKAETASAAAKKTSDSIKERATAQLDPLSCGIL